jgi:hypothetical protein
VNSDIDFQRLERENRAQMERLFHTHGMLNAAQRERELEPLNQDRICEVCPDNANECRTYSSFQEEQWYMPAKFLPPLSIGDRYCFEGGEVWQISDVDIELLDRKGEHVRVTIWWCRPAEPDPNTEDGSQWFAVHRTGDTNWIEGAKHLEIWQKCGSSGVCNETG